MNRGLTASASVTIAEALSGTSTPNTPPKNRHAASQPSITAVSVWENVNYTNICRE